MKILGYIEAQGSVNVLEKDAMKHQFEFMFLSELF